RIAELVARIDTLSVPERDVVELQFSQAQEILPVLKGLVNPPAAADTAVSQVQIVADSRTNSIILGGSLAQRERAREVVHMLDRPRVQDGNTRVVYLEYATAANVAEVLEGVLANMAGISAE